MEVMMKQGKVICAIVVVCLLCACGRTSPTETALQSPSPTQPPSATATTSPSPTSSCTPSPTATPTQTATQTATATATSTRTPTPTGTPTPTATPTPTPIVLSEAADFQGRNPLTGELVEEPADLNRRPIAVKVSNSPAEFVRPQAGLSQADLVFEHLTEGPITRFTAVFYGQVPADIGPIRSARLIDLEIPAMYDAGLAYSGASTGVTKRLYNSDLFPRMIFTWEGGYYRTGEDKPWEHTLHANPVEFWQALERKGENHAPELYGQTAFNSLPPEGGATANLLTVDYHDWTLSEWRYDSPSGRYLRWADGVEHRDANNGEQISAANVVVLWAVHEIDESICEDRPGDEKCLLGAVHIDLTGRGYATLLRDGKQYNGRWVRERRWNMLSFVTPGGDPLPLQIGPTWFQVVPSAYPELVVVLP